VTRSLIVGAGGLGGPISFALGKAGHHLTIVDHDVVEVSNLHRQLQFTASDIGHPKATRLAGAIVARGGVAKPVVGRWTAESADDIGGDVDLIVDASDSPETKFAVADWAVANGRCYVIAGALRYGGNVFGGVPGVACYRCLFEDPVEAPSCAEAGVLGPVVGAIGGVAAAIALGIVAGDRTYAGAPLAFDDLRKLAEPRIIRFAARPECTTCRRAPISPFAAPPVRVAEST